ncbi:hypothetical protein [Dokdonella sp.]|uniref:hypothetical protein n=1 Tax=Dokdonella sp. TaxID=2291710 RepID=UPI003783FAA3
MKTLLNLVFATTAATLCSSAGAANAQRELEAVTVQSRHVDCTPPSASALCSALHAQIRSQFTLREIGMLFGARTSYPEAQTAYEGLNARYGNLVREVAATFASTSDAVAAR